MNFPSNTEWRKSAKGNYWRKYKDEMLVVGGSAEKGYWIRVGENFLPDSEASLEKAKQIAEDKVDLWY